MIRSAAVIGLGKLGAPMAACLASKGFEVVGADIDIAKVEAINAGDAPVLETGLQAMIESGRERLRATTEVEEAVRMSDVSFLIVPTPSCPDGSFSLDLVLASCERIGRALRGKTGHLVVITSTVNPGSTGGPIKSVLEDSSGLRCAEGFNLCYSPEFIALGSVIDDFLNPDFVLIGESDHRAGDVLEALYHDVCDNDPPIARMAFVNAEITKLSVNTFVTTKIGFANMLADVCARLPGGDIDAVTSALSLDRRIGGDYLKGGLGYGGPCFPRDNRALAWFVRSVGVAPAIPEATDTSNEAHFIEVLEQVRSKIPTGGTVGVLGLSYKPCTDVVESAPGLELARALSAEGIEVRAHDPLAGPSVVPVPDETLTLCGSVAECIEGVDVIVVATPWKSFVEELPHAIAATGSRPVVVDCWRILEPGSLGDISDLVRLGVAP